MRYLLLLVLLGGCGRLQRVEDRIHHLEAQTVRILNIQTEAIQQIVDNQLTESYLLKDMIFRVINTEDQVIDLDRRLRGIEDVVR